jgi:L-alanine-DL-glutamate epimerase-like enolase superfamily enzyme
VIVEGDIAPELGDGRLWEVKPPQERFRQEFNESVTVKSAPDLRTVTTAMRDALGKQLETPVHQLLGGKCDDDRWSVLLRDPLA